MMCFFVFCLIELWVSISFVSVVGWRVFGGGYGWCWCLLWVVVFGCFDDE